MFADSPHATPLAERSHLDSGGDRAPLGGHKRSAGVEKVKATPGSATFSLADAKVKDCGMYFQRFSFTYFY